MEAAAVRWLTAAVVWTDRVLAFPGVRPWADALLLLAGVSGAFWAVSRLFSRLALVVHDQLDRSLADLFAVVYNAFLAALYASVLARCVGAAASDRLAFQGAGFVILYLTLNAAYSDGDGAVDEHALPGWLAGLGGYLLLCARPAWTANPATLKTHAALGWLLRHGVGRWLTCLALALYGLRLLRRLALKYPRIWLPGSRRALRPMKRMRTKDI